MLPPLTPILPTTILVPSARRRRCHVFLLLPLLVRIHLFFFPVVLLDFPGLLLVQERPIHPIWATHAQTSSKWGGSSVHPTSSNIAAILGKAAEFGIKIPPFPTDDAFPTNLLGIPTHGSALTSVENLISWNCELRNSWRDYASAHIAHNALLAQVEISKQRITNNDKHRRLVWAAWCYLQGCTLVANLPDSPSPERSRSQSKGKGKGKARARSSDESVVQLVKGSIDRGDGLEEKEEDKDGAEGEAGNEDGDDDNGGAGSGGGSVMELS